MTRASVARHEALLVGLLTSAALAMRVAGIGQSLFGDELFTYADLAGYGGRHHKAIWHVFAHRGMGYYAGSFGGNDTAPGASFRVPPTDSAGRDTTSRCASALSPASNS